MLPRMSASALKATTTLRQFTSNAILSRDRSGSFDRAAKALEHQANVDGTATTSDDISPVPQGGAPLTSEQPEIKDESIRSQAQVRLDGTLYRNTTNDQQDQSNAADNGKAYSAELDYSSTPHTYAEPARSSKSLDNSRPAILQALPDSIRRVCRGPKEQNESSSDWEGMLDFQRLAPWA